MCEQKPKDHDFDLDEMRMQLEKNMTYFKKEASGK